MLAGCVPVPPELMPPPEAGRAVVGAVFPGLDAGAAQEQGLHFMVHAYQGDRAKELVKKAEDDYDRIMRDTGLYSFRPAGLYELVIYASADEFRKKTNQPEWSGGVTVGNSIYSYEGPFLDSTLAHEMTHLIFNEFMGNAGMSLRWLNEGLAVYEEYQASPSSLKADWDGRMNKARETALPFDQMFNLVPATEKDRLVSQWYSQVGSVVRFVIERGGGLGFAQFLNSLKAGQAPATAVNSAFPGLWTGLPALEDSWKRST